MKGNKKTHFHTKLFNFKIASSINLILAEKMYIISSFFFSRICKKHVSLQILNVLLTDNLKNTQINKNI